MIFMIINVIVFLLINIFIQSSKISGQGATSVLAVDALCLFGNFDVFISHFWTLGTYMFVHFDLLHLVSNMLWLWFLGRVFCELLGSKKMYGVYILGGVSGGIMYLISSSFIAVENQTFLLGASGSVMAIVVAVATASPDYRVFPFGMPMKLKWLALISVAITTLVNISDNTGGKAAHLGGALFGLVYGYLLRKGNPFTELFKPKSKLRIAHSRMTDEEYNSGKSSTRKRVDEILDKISRAGYDSLTREEKDFLQKNHDKL
jgi:membrane associated rhomboid family serine protease